MAERDTAFLSVRHLVKRFGSHTALSDVSLDIRAGVLVCLLAPPLLERWRRQAG